MRRYRYHITAVAILFLLVLFFHQYRGSNRSFLWSTGFAISNYEDIDRVLISDGYVDLTLTRDEGDWVVNRRFEARGKAVDMLLQTFGRLRVSSPVPRNMLETVEEGLSSEAVRVEAHVGRRSHIYYIWSPGPGKATYMIKEGADEPVVVEVVGFNGHVASLFVTDPGYWRPNVLFSIPPNDIAEVIVHHSEDEQGSFVLRQPRPGVYKLYGHAGEEACEGMNDSLAVRFLSNFIYVPYERLAREKELELSDSLLAAGHDYFIRVTCREGSVSDLYLHRIINEYENGDPVFDLFRLHGLLEGGSEMVIVPYHSVDLILRKITYFYLSGG